MSKGGDLYLIAKAVKPRAATNVKTMRTRPQRPGGYKGDAAKWRNA